MAYADLSESQKVAARKASAKYKKTKSGAITARKAQLKHKFNITIDEYEALYISQGGRCKICLGKNENGKALAVDHDHETKEVRGLLCNNCNAAIGLLRDDIKLVFRAMAYLLREKLK